MLRPVPIFGHYFNAPPWNPVIERLDRLGKDLSLQSLAEGKTKLFSLTSIKIRYSQYPHLQIQSFSAAVRPRSLNAG